jgi:hypothetical protein
VTEVEKIACSMYDHAMSLRDPEIHGWHWTPWQDLKPEDREPYLEAAHERVRERDAVRALTKLLEDTERRWDDSHPSYGLLPGAIVPMGYLAKAVLEAGYRLAEQEEGS